MIGPTPDRVGAPAGRLPGWDGLRALAATSVLILHTSVFRTTGSVHDVVAQFQAGVQVFFVVSGFVITRPFVAAILDEKPLPALRAYLTRRCFRIFPAYWLALVGTALVLDEAYLRNTKDWVSNLLLVQAYTAEEFNRGISIAWTLSVEVAFYVFVPLMFLVIERLARRVRPLTALGVVIGALFVASCVYAQWTVSSHHLVQTFWFPFHLSVLLVGTVMAVGAELALRRPTVGILAERVGRLASLWWAAAAACVLLAARLFGASVVYRANHIIGMQVLYGLMAAFAVIPVAFGFRTRGAVGRFLGARPVVYVGVASYGIYLWHNPLARVVTADWLGWGPTQGSAAIVTVAVFAVTLAFASASWFLLEKPVMRRTGRAVAPWARRAA